MAQNRKKKKSTTKLDFQRLGLIGLAVFFLMMAFSDVREKILDMAFSSLGTAEETTVSYCLRQKPYYMEPEFERALSLIRQRFHNLNKTRYGESEVVIYYFNCLDVQYSNLNETEGIFYFDENNASTNRLSIKVDNSYKENDDILTAILIDHELTHAYQYIQEVIKNKRPMENCVDKEISAYISQILFIQTLNPEELNSINRRLVAGYNNLNSSLKMVWDLITFENKARRYCINGIDYDKGESDCYFNLLKDDIGKMVKSNPYYQTQCDL